MTSLVSANGPSDTSSSPFRTRTVRAADVGARASPSKRRPRASFSATQTSISGSSVLSVSGLVSVQTNIMYFISALLRVGVHQGDDRAAAYRTGWRRRTQCWHADYRGERDRRAVQRPAADPARQPAAVPGLPDDPHWGTGLLRGGHRRRGRGRDPRRSGGLPPGSARLRGRVRADRELSAARLVRALGPALHGYGVRSAEWLTVFGFE